MAIVKVALVGANGTLGPSILEALQAASFEVSVVVRASSNSKYSENVTLSRISDEMKHDELVTALKGQDALILAFSGTMTAASMKYADAALEAGVKRVIPADYGSCDSSDPRSLEMVPLYKEKEKVRNYLMKLSNESKGVLTWTSLITGHFLDFGLSSGLLQMNLKEKTARIFDGGDIKWSATTLGGIALAVVRILQHEEATKNKLIYVQGVVSTQNELLEVVEEAMGAKFRVEHISSNDFIKKYKARLAENSDDGEATTELVSVEGTVNAYWENRKGFSNELLGIPKENLKDVVKKEVEQL